MLNSSLIYIYMALVAAKQKKCHWNNFFCHQTGYLKDPVKTLFDGIFVQIFNSQFNLKTVFNVAFVPGS